MKDSLSIRFQVLSKPLKLLKLMALDTFLANFDSL